MIPAPIDRVRVYSMGATVTRRVTLQAPIPAQLEIAGLPLSLVDSTVQVRSSDDAVVTGAVVVGLHAAPPEATPDSPDEIELRGIERRIDQIRHTLDLVGAESELLRRLEVPERPEGEEGKPPPASPMRARVALEQLTDSAIQARLDEARVLRHELERKQEEAAALRDAIHRASLACRARPDQLTKTVIAALDGTAAEVTIEVEYFVLGARWTPQYQCDIAPDGTHAAIRLRASVCQASGEDWRNVALELSTAAPRSFSELPTLASVRIGRAQPTPVLRGYREAPRGSEALYADYDRERHRTRGLLPSRPSLALPVLHIAALDEIHSPPEPACEEPMLGGSAAYELDEEAPVAKRMQAPMPAAAPPPRPADARPSPVQRKASRSEARADSFGSLEPSLDDDRGGSEPTAGGQIPFARLRLGPASTNLRSKLTVESDHADYLALLQRSGLQVDFDVLATVRQASDLAASAGRLPLPHGSVDVRAVAGHFDYAYRADDRVDVPSDLAFHSIPLGTRQADCVVTYVVVPRVDTNVFRIAAIHNPTEAPLLPGPTEVYVGGEYVLSTTLPVVAPRERFRLGLGVEQGIRCARNTRFREARAGTNVVAMAELHHEIDVELTNNLSRTIQCEVRERIPQPDKDAEVDVEEVDVTPPWEEWNQVPLGQKLVGGRRWHLEVPARSTASVTAHYVVKLYANNEIVGGNRREA